MEVGEIKEELSALIADALSALPIARFVADCTPNILPSQPKFGDFQWKDCMVMFKSVPAGHFDSAPALAAAIVFHLPKSDIIQSVSVAPGKVGIINFRLYDVLKSAPGQGPLSALWQVFLVRAINSQSPEWQARGIWRRTHT
jgi:arginyl-tRNA synthetase